jgi:CheY-like chemotaxis protein
MSISPHARLDDQTVDVLVVEDDCILRREIARTLEDEGLTVAAAAGGQEALALLAGDKRAKVVLIDIWMPDMDGSELLHELAWSQMATSARLVVMTGCPDSVIAQGLARAGVPLLRKPFTSSQLHAAIDLCDMLR